MDPHSIFEGLSSPDVSAADSAHRGWPGTPSVETKPEEVRFPGEDGGKSLAEIAHRDLDAALQLLAEQAQYITGATGAAIALRDQEEMLCRASAGHSAPEVGSQLQVNSGLSGESVRTRETLRCDDAATDPRVNRESCEALGIASVVVMPLVHGNEVIGVFELFSDKTNAFETRDLVALERMGKMIFTALGHGGAHDLAGEEEQQPVETQTAVESPAAPGSAEDAGSAAAVLNGSEHDGNAQITQAGPPATPAQTDIGAHHEEAESVLEVPETFSGAVFHGSGSTGAMTAGSSLDTKSKTFVPQEDNDDILGDVPQVVSTPHDSSTPEGEGGFREEAGASSPDLSEQASEKVTDTTSEAQISRSPVAGLKRCEACGFPISEGRQFCLDCEKKKGLEAPTTSKETVAFATKSAESQTSSVPFAPPVFAEGDETPQLFCDGSDEKSWVASHKYMIVAVAIAVLLVVLFLLAR
jgi:putative methionine-R-sulfoxide reductase with GAF domain